VAEIPMWVPAGRFITGVFITSFHVCDLFELSDLLPT
jgi:hypothetical protein